MQSLTTKALSMAHRHLACGIGHKFAPSSSEMGGAVHASVRIIATGPGNLPYLLGSMVCASTLLLVSIRPFLEICGPLHAVTIPNTSKVRRLRHKGSIGMSCIGSCRHIRDLTPLSSQSHWAALAPGWSTASKPADHLHQPCPTPHLETRK